MKKCRRRRESNLHLLASILGLPPFPIVIDGILQSRWLRRDLNGLHCFEVSPDKQTDL